MNDELSHVTNRWLLSGRWWKLGGGAASESNSSYEGDCN